MKKGFTILECIICITVLSGIFSSYIYFSHVYYKNKSIRDNQLEQIVENINTVEYIRSHINDLSDLYDYYKAKPTIDIYLVGSGKCEMIKEGGVVKVKIVDNSEQGNVPLQQTSPHLFRIVISKGDIHSQQSTIIRIGGA